MTDHTAPSSQPLPRHVAVIGAAGGLGQGILSVCRIENIAFTAIVRSRPERITDVPDGSRVVVVKSLADSTALTEAFTGTDAVITAMGVTSASSDSSALLSANIATIEASMTTAGVDRLIIINTIGASPPGKAANRIIRIFSKMPGVMGKGATEQQEVVDALGSGAFPSLRWTLVRAGVNSHGKDERPVALAEWDKALISLKPVSYQAMGRWMLEEAAANEFVRTAPVVSRRR